MKRFIPVVAVAGFMFSSAMAADISPAVVYDKAGKNDKSFNEAVYHGITKFTKDTGIKVREVEPTNEAQVGQGLSKLAKRKSSPIVGVGFSMASAVEKAATENPETKFTIIDMVVGLPNVQSIVFAEHEGSFLVGALAAMKSTTAKVGFVGGMDIPLIRKFSCGYEQGAKYQNKDVEVMSNMIGSTGAAFNNPSKGGELAKSQFEKGADVVFAAAFKGRKIVGFKGGKQDARQDPMKRPQGPRVHARTMDTCTKSILPLVGSGQSQPRLQIRSS